MVVVLVCYLANSKKWGAKHVIGYDISKGMLNYARQQEKNDPLGIDYISDIPFDCYQYFDVIIAPYPLVCIGDYNELKVTIERMAHLLKPQGKLITIVLNTNLSDIPEFYRRYGFNIEDSAPRADGSITNVNFRLPENEVSIPIYYWFAETLDKLLSQAGFHHMQKIELVSPPEEYLTELADYIACPHTNITTATKK